MSEKHTDNIRKFLNKWILCFHPVLLSILFTTLLVFQNTEHYVISIVSRNINSNQIWCDVDGRQLDLRKFCGQIFRSSRSLSWREDVHMATVTYLLLVMSGICGRWIVHLVVFPDSKVGFAGCDTLSQWEMMFNASRNSGYQSVVCWLNHPRVRSTRFQLSSPEIDNTSSYPPLSSSSSPFSDGCQDPENRKVA